MTKSINQNNMALIRIARHHTPLLMSHYLPCSHGNLF